MRLYSKARVMILVTISFILYVLLSYSFPLFFFLNSFLYFFVFLCVYFSVFFCSISLLFCHNEVATPFYFFFFYLSERAKTLYLLYRINFLQKKEKNNKVYGIYMIFCENTKERRRALSSSALSQSFLFFLSLFLFVFLNCPF